jgi:hypothetical protein
MPVTDAPMPGQEKNVSTFRQAMHGGIDAFVIGSVAFAEVLVGMDNEHLNRI